MTDTTEVTVSKQAHVPTAQEHAALTPASLLSLVVTQGADIEKIKAFMDLQDRYEAKMANRNYTISMAAFKANPPFIVKDKEVKFGKTAYSHASLGQVSQKINSALSVYELTAKWGIEQGGFGVRVTCTISHIDGHFESTSMESPPDNSGGKNAIQAISSAVSYLQRYTILALTGLATSESDDDGAASGYSAEHIQEIKITFEEFKSGIDFYKKHKFTADNLDKWFESKEPSLRLLSTRERSGLTEHLMAAFDWLDENGRDAKVECPESKNRMLKSECLGSKCHKTCPAMGNTPKSKMEIDI